MNPNDEDKKQLQQHAETLMHAISQGNFNAAIFSDPDCMRYNLYLLRENKINIDEFLTVQVYLSALMLYTDQQPLKEKDAHLKRITEVTTIPIAQIERRLIDKFNTTHYRTFLNHEMSDIEQERLKLAFLQLSAFDQQVIKIKQPSSLKDEVERQTARYCHSPLLLSDKEYYYIPSVAALKAMLSIMNPEMPLHPAPIFGRISFATLYQLHKQGFHPVALYAPFINTNPENIHGKNPGPLAALLHDLGGHVYFGNLLSRNLYQFLFQKLLPLIINDSQLNGASLVEEQGKLLNIHSVIDLNFTEIGKKYLIPNLAHGVLRLDDQNNPEDQFELFKPLIQQLLHDEKEIWEKYQIDIRDFLQTGYYDILNKVTKTVHHR